MPRRWQHTQAARQHGVLSRSQTNGSAGNEVRSGRLLVAHKGVYVVAGSPATWEQKVVAAVHAAGEGAAAAGRSAGRIWGLEGLEDCPSIEVLVTHSRRRRPRGVVVHRSRTIRPGDIRSKGGIPVTTVVRTLLDLSASLSPEQLEDTLDDALRRGLTTVRKVLERIGSEPTNGRKGIGTLRRLAQSRLDGRIPGSGRENALRRLLERAGMWPQRQVAVRDLDGSLIAIVDLAFPEQRVALEYDGNAFHTGRKRVTMDKRRGRRLARAGWIVLPYTIEDVRDRPDEVVAEVREVLRLRSGGG